MSTPAAERERRPRLVADVLRRAAAEAPDQIGVERLDVDGAAGSAAGGAAGAAAAEGAGATTLTYGEWDARASRAARALQRRGLAKGDRVALAFSNAGVLDWYACYFGVHKAGGVAVPLGARLAAAEMAAILRHAEPRLALAEPGLLARVREAAAGQPVLVLAADEVVRDAAAPADDPHVEVAPDDLADILYTSGTTGTPKGVACTQAAVAAMANKALAGFAGQPFLHAVPVYTFAGAHAMTFLPLRARMPALVMVAFDAERYLALVEERAVAASFVVPAMGRLLLDAPSSGRRDTRALRLLMFGSAPTPPSTVEGLARLFPEAYLLNVYSTTEAGAAACALPPGEATRRPGSVGIPVPPADVRVVRDDGAPAAPGERGEVLLKTVAPPRAYFRDPEATAAAWVDGEWLRTGDIGYRDAEGYLYLVDRKNDLVIRGGFNVYTGEVDAVIEGHPAVREAAVIGVPHDVLGEEVCAFVALRPGAVATAGDLRAHCLARLADYKSPREWLFVDALPRSALGKVLKRDLRERWQAERARLAHTPAPARREER